MADASGYNLRPREGIRPPNGLQISLEEEQRRQLAQIRRQRNGKSSGVDKRVNQIN